MGLFDVLKGKPVTATELRGHVLKAIDVMGEMHIIMQAMPAQLREAAFLSYVQRVGEPMEGTMARLVRVERTLLQGEVSDVPRYELNELRDVMQRLKVHLLRSYSDSRLLPQGAEGRRKVRQVAKGRNDVLCALIGALDRVID